MILNDRYLKAYISQINPEFMWSFFKPKNLPYNLRKGPILHLPRTQSTYYSTNAIHFTGFSFRIKLKLKIGEILTVDV